MTAGDASQTTPDQIMYVFLLYTNCVHAILNPIITYWCVLSYSYNTSISRISLLLHKTEGEAQDRVLITMIFYECL